MNPLIAVVTGGGDLPVPAAGAGGVHGGAGDDEVVDGAADLNHANQADRTTRDIRDPHSSVKESDASPESRPRPHAAGRPATVDSGRATRGSAIPERVACLRRRGPWLSARQHVQFWRSDSAATSSQKPNERSSRRVLKPAPGLFRVALARPILVPWDSRSRTRSCRPARPEDLAHREAACRARPPA
jgi:hypothetical protein